MQANTEARKLMKERVTAMVTYFLFYLRQLYNAQFLGSVSYK